jgi:hypothetical protein
MRLVETVPGESGEVCVFSPCRDGKTVTGDQFRMARPVMKQGVGPALIDVLREFLEEDRLQ